MHCSKLLRTTVSKHFIDRKELKMVWTKQNIYEGERQFKSQQQLWEPILSSCNEVQAETLHKLTSSMDRRMVKLLSK